METTATYDKETEEFIVNTPTPLAQKYWITNGACHAHHVVVFSQLYIDGVNQGSYFTPGLTSYVTHLSVGSSVCFFLSFLQFFYVSFYLLLPSTLTLVLPPSFHPYLPFQTPYFPFTLLPSFLPSSSSISTLLPSSLPSSLLTSLSPSFPPPCLLSYLLSPPSLIFYLLSFLL